MLEVGTSSEVSWRLMTTYSGNNGFGNPYHCISLISLGLGILTLLVLLIYMALSQFLCLCEKLADDFF